MELKDPGCHILKAVGPTLIYSLRLFSSWGEVSLTLTVSPFKTNIHYYPPKATVQAEGVKKVWTG